PYIGPILGVLLLGVTTDYSVFFFDGLRGRLAVGEPRVRAARLSTAEGGPIIATAGLTEEAATASLAVARARGRGPAGAGRAAGPRGGRADHRHGRPYRRGRHWLGGGGQDGVAARVRPR